MANELQDRKVAILLAPRGTEQVEFEGSKKAVEAAGASVDVVSDQTGEVRAVNNDLEADQKRLRARGHERTRKKERSTHGRRQAHLTQGARRLRLPRREPGGATLLGFGGTARTLSYLFGGMQGLLNALTDQSQALKRLLPFRTLELSSGPLFVALPWVTGSLKDPMARNHFLALGAYSSPSTT
jgi:hypothetical protein